MLESLDINQIVNEYVIPWAINIVMALVIYIVGRIAIKIVISVTRKVMARARMDEMLINFIASILSGMLTLFVIIAALDQLGVDTTSLIALLGAAGLAVGLSMQSSLSNFAAGVMLIVFRPFKLGDYIEAGGVAGTVEHISIFSTTLKTGDNREIIVPNGAIYGGTITNGSARSTRRIDMEFGIGYGDDIKQARDIMMAILEADDRILTDPAPLIAVAELADSSVNFVVRPWVNSSDYWAVKFDLLEGIKLAFDEAGVSIPYPQMDVHVEKTAA